MMYTSLNLNVAVSATFSTSREEKRDGKKDGDLMKLNKAKLKQIIREVLSEGITDSDVQSTSQIRQTQKGTEAQAEVGKLAPRERQVVSALGNIQKAMAAPGNQATSRVILLLQRLMDELEKGKDVTVDPGETQ